MGKYTGKKYCPSNGTEGDWFEDKFCMNCIHTNPDPCKKPQCEIWCRAVCWNVNDEHFPTEWQYDNDDKPVCTAWVKWDWGNDGDPNARDNPKAPIQDDPNQLCMPFIIDEIERNTVRKEEKVLLNI
jgi:hypothetical protein